MFSMPKRSSHPIVNSGKLTGIPASSSIFSSCPSLFLVRKRLANVAKRRRYTSSSFHRCRSFCSSSMYVRGLNSTFVAFLRIRIVFTMFFVVAVVVRLRMR